MPRPLIIAACAMGFLALHELARRADGTESESIEKNLSATVAHRGPAAGTPAAPRAVRQTESALAAQARELAATPGSRVETLRDILLALAQEDPRLALELACASPLRLANDTPLAGPIAARLADRDLATALLLLRNLDPRTPAGHAACTAVFDVVGQRGDFAGALRCVREVCAPETQMSFIQRIVLDWSAASPDAASRWIRTEPDAALRDRLLVEAGQNRFALDPAQATELTLQVRDPALRVASLTEALLGWFDADPAAATRWLERFPPHEDLDHFATRIATLPALAATRIEVALSWAESISQPTLRLESLATLIDTWSRRDADAAARYISTTSTLSAEEKATLLARVRNPHAPGPKG